MRRNSSAVGGWRIASGGNASLFWPVLMIVTAIDALTKAVAERLLVPERMPHDLLDGWLRFTLVHNPGAAFGLNVGAHSRWVFMALTVGALWILTRLYQGTREGHWTRVFALALVCGGAVGNLLDRLRIHSQGVVDFIDVGWGDARWPTFNVADMAVSVGAFLLAVVLWQEDRDAEEISLAASVTTVPAELQGEPGEVA